MPNYRPKGAETMRGPGRSSGVKSGETRRRNRDERIIRGYAYEKWGIETPGPRRMAAHPWCLTCRQSSAGVSLRNKLKPCACGCAAARTRRTGGVRSVAISTSKSKLRPRPREGGFPALACARAPNSIASRRFSGTADSSGGFAYLRVSGRGQIEGDGFTRQRAAIKA